MYRIYCKKSKKINFDNDVDLEVTNEYNSHMSVLKQEITNLKKESQESAETIKEEYEPLLKANNELIKLVI